jgi:hypothetical protein
MHQVLIGLPQGVGGLAILFYLILFLFLQREQQYEIYVVSKFVCMYT